MDKRVLDDIYSFWFGPDHPVDRLCPDRIEMWMNQSDATDSAVRERFGALLPEAARIDWDVAALSRQQGLALVVLFDQFPRNLYRTTGEAYAYDHLGRAIARQLIDSGWDGFTLMERFLLGLPFVHHEDIDDQDYALKLAIDIAHAIPQPDREPHRMHLDQATRHRDLIRRFGRFPHRNAALGRASTADETAFMAEHGRGF